LIQSTTALIVGSVAAVFLAELWVARRLRALFFLIVIQIAWILNYCWIPAIELWLEPLACVFFGVYRFAEITKSMCPSPTP